MSVAAPHSFETVSSGLPPVRPNRQAPARDPAFAAFVDTNVAKHKRAGYGVLTISLKPIVGIPGDATAEQMELVADLAESFGHDEIRVSHEQNLVLPHVALDDLPAMMAQVEASGVPDARFGIPRYHPPAQEDSGLTIAYLIDPDGTLLRLIQND
jgi:sulfite reductase (NADPH) hemoprotein beta-component